MNFFILGQEAMIKNDSSVCFFVSDLHGKTDRYEKLFHIIQEEKPDVVFLGGDLLPHRLKKVGDYNCFTKDFFFGNLRKLKKILRFDFPDILLILGNDDPRSEENKFLAENEKGLIYYLHMNNIKYRDFNIFGYSYVPPTPFRLKDWEKHDVDFTTRPGCIRISDGFRTSPPPENIETTTIADDIKKLASINNKRKTIGLFHSPPYNTFLDRAGLDGMKINEQQLDVHVGSIAIRNYIEEKQPVITLHGHIHESAKRTGQWKQKIGNTYCFNAAHGGPELRLIRFNIDEPFDAEISLI